MINNDFNLKGSSGAKGSSEKTAIYSEKAPKKEFQKVLAKEEAGERGQGRQKKKLGSEEKISDIKDSFQEFANESEIAEADQKAKSPSLFDLAAKTDIEAEDVQGSLKAEEELLIKELPEEIQKGAMTAIHRGYGLKEQSDLAAVNPFVIDQMRAPFEAPMVLHKESTQSAFSNMKEVIDQIINKLYIVERGEKTETLITLKHPPLFAGSTIVITEFKTAKREFNISFENLTQEAKAILDRRENTNALKSALSEKGYIIHMITTTTLAETVSVPSDKMERQEMQEKDQEHQSSGKKKGQTKDDE